MEAASLVNSAETTEKFHKDLRELNEFVATFREWSWKVTELVGKLPGTTQPEQDQLYVWQKKMDAFLTPEPEEPVCPS